MPGARGCEEVINAKQQEETLGVDGKASYLDCQGHYRSAYLKTHLTIHFKWVRVTTCKLYLGEVELLNTALFQLGSQRQALSIIELND